MHAKIHPESSTLADILGKLTWMAHARTVVGVLLYGQLGCLVVVVVVGSAGK